MADQVDELARAAVRAWATVARAWSEAANAIVVSWLDLPAVESGRAGFNEEVVPVPPQGVPTTLHPGPFVDAWGDTEVSPDAVAVVPTLVGGGTDTQVIVRILQPDKLASGTYTGSLLDSPGGQCLVDEIGVYVVGGRAP